MKLAGWWTEEQELWADLQGNGPSRAETQSEFVQLSLTPALPMNLNMPRLIITGLRILWFRGARRDLNRGVLSLWERAGVRGKGMWAHSAVGWQLATHEGERRRRAAHAFKPSRFAEGRCRAKRTSADGDSRRRWTPIHQAFNPGRCCGRSG